MAEPNGNGATLRWLVQLFLPAALAVIGSYAAVTAKLAILEERIAGVRTEMAIQNDNNREAHQRLEAKDIVLAAELAVVRREKR